MHTKVAINLSFVIVFTTLLCFFPISMNIFEKPQNGTSHYISYETEAPYFSFKNKR